MSPPSEYDERPPAPRPVVGRAAPELVATLAADWAAASVARERLGRWLRDLDWPPAQRDELVLAASEAVSNSVEHGYGVPHDVVDHDGLVTMRATVEMERDGHRRVRIVVADAGGWVERDGSRDRRGHGLTIMRACTDELTVDGTAEGTTVVLHSRAAPPDV